jgi:magnesium chelatase family protein
VRRRYLAKLSGPLLDRIDLRVELFPLVRSALFAEGARGESSAVVARRVVTARETAAARLAGTPWHTNAEVPGMVLRSRWRLPARVLVDASTALERGEISARGFDRVLRCAWTIADLGGHDSPDRYDVGEAVGFRIGAVAA